MCRRLKVFFSLDKLFELNLTCKDKKKRKKNTDTLATRREFTPPLSAKQPALVPLQLWIGDIVNKMHGLNGLKHCCLLTGSLHEKTSVPLYELEKPRKAVKLCLFSFKDMSPAVLWHSCSMVGSVLLNQSLELTCNFEWCNSTSVYLASIMQSDTFTQPNKHCSCFRGVLLQLHLWFPQVCNSFF